MPKQELTYSIVKPIEKGGNTYKLRAKPDEIKLAGVKICHPLASCTRFPTVYSPKNKPFSYIDTPCFGDNLHVNT